MSEVDEDRQHDDRPAVVADEAVDPLERLEQRHDEPGEHAEVDRVVRARASTALQHVEVLRADEERHRHRARRRGAGVGLTENAMNVRVRPAVLPGTGSVSGWYSTRAARSPAAAAVRRRTDPRRRQSGTSPS